MKNKIALWQNKWMLDNLWLSLRYDDVIQNAKKIASSLLCSKFSKVNVSDQIHSQFNP